MNRITHSVNLYATDVKPEKRYIFDAEMQSGYMLHYLVRIDNDDLAIILVPRNASRIIGMVIQNYACSALWFTDFIATEVPISGLGSGISHSRLFAIQSNRAARGSYDPWGVVVHEINMNYSYDTLSTCKKIGRIPEKDKSVGRVVNDTIKFYFDEKRFIGEGMITKVFSKLKYEVTLLKKMSVFPEKSLLLVMEQDIKK